MIKPRMPTRDVEIFRPKCPAILRRESPTVPRRRLVAKTRATKRESVSWGPKLPPVPSSVFLAEKDPDGGRFGQLVLTHIFRRICRVFFRYAACIGLSDTFDPCATVPASPVCTSLRGLPRLFSNHNSVSDSDFGEASNRPAALRGTYAFEHFAIHFVDVGKSKFLNRCRAAAGGSSVWGVMTGVLPARAVRA